jgi:hypothetical protein
VVAVDDVQDRPPLPGGHAPVDQVGFGDFGGVRQEIEERRQAVGIDANGDPELFHVRVLRESLINSACISHRSATAEAAMPTFE